MKKFLKVFLALLKVLPLTWQLVGHVGGEAGPVQLFLDDAYVRYWFFKNRNNFCKLVKLGHLLFFLASVLQKEIDVFRIFLF